MTEKTPQILSNISTLSWSKNIFSYFLNETRNLREHKNNLSSLYSQVLTAWEEQSPSVVYFVFEINSRLWIEDLKGSIYVVAFFIIIFYLEFGILR